MPAKNPIAAVPIAAADREVEGFHRTCAKVTACTPPGVSRAVAAARHCTLRGGSFAATLIRRSVPAPTGRFTIAHHSAFVIARRP